ncbi:hypothetical protein MHYP_G00045610 [Metynnis hypsauchen]
MGNLVGRSVIIKEICNGFGLGSLGRRGPNQTSAEFRCVLGQDNRILQRERVVFLLFRPLHPLLKGEQHRAKGQTKSPKKSAATEMLRITTHSYMDSETFAQCEREGLGDKAVPVWVNRHAIMRRGPTNRIRRVEVR